MGNKIPVEAFPPKIMASVGTTNIDTPGIPTFDIPTNMAQKPSNIHWSTEKSRFTINSMFSGQKYGK
jgi:hypothetical protein